MHEVFVIISFRASINSPSSVLFGKEASSSDQHRESADVYRIHTRRRINKHIIGRSCLLARIFPFAEIKMILSSRLLLLVVLLVVLLLHTKKNNMSNHLYE
jgi:hypothetical protein